ncbi:uncharacterized protein VICG_01284 [Vittaforma corneae ATCC 50505]|uniref:SMC hinge domain-containing protein n=1 Tax=Vittaforma corneae (strain ATCC 50505) TaxID=993615 RepID=L2GLD4_VITCO|nr:uncharacterized protein VICG_01284 [Vittaforma corneae ATCC 50505]ELA41651.1 hypothetical protein VICG_01284 [Vittaforma corneae ATCC 50505]
MFIKDVIMDGFKCYTDKTVVKNLDRFFTAITGMNGSGKSNIIDAIIFALDLSTSKYMRVSNLKELININRKECSVNKSPIGYESYDCIEITRSLDSEGKSKYRLNGHNSTKMSIENLCKSIGITNDFIVMQGHITKIVNMKSADLQSMIEETAGTRNYSLEREKSLELLTKKEFKLKEAREHLKKTISPFFEELKKEKKIYEENRDSQVNRKAYIQELEILENQMAGIELASKVEELNRMGVQYFQEKAELESMEMKIKEISTMQAINASDLNGKINIEKDRLEELRGQDPSEQIDSKVEEYEKGVRILERPPVFDLNELSARENILSKEILGGADIDKIAELERLKEFLNRKTVELEMARSEVEKQNKKLNYQKPRDGCCEDISEEMLRIVKNLLEEYELKDATIRSFEEKISSLKSKIFYPIIEGVYGTVDENFDFVDQKYKEAILTILGGRSKFVICRDEEVASKVIQTSDRKISCIPLDKITYLEPNRVPYSCINALDAISFNTKYDKAFKHIFSGFYIFEDKAKAATCCFECKVGCVTLDGTVYDPKGTLTGGKSYFKYDVTRMSDIKKLERDVECLRMNMPQFNIACELRGIYNSLSNVICLSKDISSLRSKAEILQGLATSKIDVKTELQNVRNMIVEATKENNIRSTAQAKCEMLKNEIDGLTVIKNDLEKQIALSMERIAQLQSRQRAFELEENSRRASIRMMESLDEKLKVLIKSTVKLASRIARLYDEIKLLANQVFQNQMNENLTNISTQIQHNGSGLASIVPANFTDNYIEFMEASFGVEKRIILFKFNNDNVNTKYIEERMGFLKEKIHQKRVVVSMDPSNFELLEKNAAAVQDLEEKIRKLESDKIEILKSIERLNEMGVKENQRAFEHINKTLRTFLGYFLKNSDVFISPEFEIKVKVGNWKNSLSELSGGQKSLIALCLIFSMLTFKPAPFYIFDEIDAALDLNYTQSIGEIIQKEFHGAQFIVVSLKNNMFDNANRIFKVFIQDHRSKVCQIK